MMLLLSKKLYSSHPCFTTIKAILNPPSHPYLFSCLLPFSSSASAIQNPNPKPCFIEEYLVTTCGFSPETAAEAAEASKLLASIKSPKQPDSVLGFFRSNDFDDTQIRDLISRKPRWLYFNVEKTLEPRFRALQDLGFSRSDLTYLVLSSPHVLDHKVHRTVLPKIELWRGLLGSTEILMKFLKKKQWLLQYSIEKRILPNLKLLRDCGISDKRISMVVKHHPRFILQKQGSLKALIELVEGLGIPRSSRMFLWALQSLSMVSEVRFKAKLELMRSLGWSELDFLYAFRRAPVFLSVSEKMMRKKMDFLVKKAGCEPSYLALQPSLLMYSLEKRLIPRYHIMEILKSRGLRGGDFKLPTIMDLTEKEFVEGFVLCHKNEVPELYEVYIAGCDMGGAL